MLHKTNFNVDHTVLLSCVDRMIADGTIPAEQGQFGFVYPTGETEFNPRSAIGSLAHGELREKDFTTFLNPSEHPEMYHFYQSVAEYSPFKLGRMRIMIMQPKSCLSLHEDRELRYHLALRTSEKSLLLARDRNDIFRAYHVPADGNLYQFDARTMHTALNASLDEPRIHILICTTGDIK